MTIYDFELEDNQGKKVALRDFSGKALLIVNTATRCGIYAAVQGAGRIVSEIQGLWIRNHRHSL